MDLTVQQRNTGLDFLKFLSCLLVINIHMSSAFKEYVLILSRAAVPIFFMISGYYHKQTKSRGRQGKQIKKIFSLFLFSHLLYFFIELLASIADKSVMAFLGAFLDLKFWVKFLLFNEAMISVQIWYLSALLYILVLLVLFEKRFPISRLYFLIPILLFANLLIGTYSYAILGLELPIIISRNFLFCGLPFYLLGSFLSEKDLSMSDKSGYLIFAAVFFYLCSFAEMSLLERSGLLYNSDIYISSIPLTVSLFVFAINLKGKPDASLYSRFACWGRKYSTSIYIIHPIIISLLMLAVNCFPADSVIPRVYNFISPLVVLFVCTFLSWLIAECGKIFSFRLK